MVLISVKKVIMPVKYLNFVNVILKELPNMLFKYAKMNEHVIKLVNHKQPLYRPIYSLRIVELKTLEIYIKSTWPISTSGH